MVGNGSSILFRIDVWDGTILFQCMVVGGKLEIISYKEDVGWRGRLTTWEEIPKTRCKDEA